MFGYDAVNDDGGCDKHYSYGGSECDHDGNAAAEEEADDTREWW